MQATVDRIRGAARAEGFELTPDQARVAEALAFSPRGVYAHGPVGRGKTWVADAFWRAAAPPGALRVHAHALLDALHRAVFARHEERRAARDAGGGRPADEDRAADPLPDPPADPVDEAIGDVLGGARALLIDDLQIVDPAEARLVGRILSHARAHDVRIVATSNYAPEDLLADPEWHRLAEPAIRLIRDHLTVVELAGGDDFRAHGAGGGFASGSWRVVPDAATLPARAALRAEGRTFAAVSAADGALTITFAQLCEAVTSTRDYLAWARRFGAWTILDVPPLARVDPAAHQRFITVVDVLADADVRLDVVARRTRAETLDAPPLPGSARLASRLLLLG
ncbi:AFG1/ZapE family ATPase [Microbacterium excoecariae]|uniref:AFG1/ZapE family ATPase n=1 Tax=Microbacterium excoecariae TaxID=2715210 RepID=UPI0014072D93|nr:AFG1/ZapE family ATPase [Microbacterium excoecariae]NHI16161.1 cell division protein ZapE [Microbacterium excoecariae]